MTANRATGADDPELSDTSWPMPHRSSPISNGVEWQLRHAYTVSFAARLEAASIVSAYRALIEDGTTAQQLRRLAALRRVHRRRSRR